MNQRDRAGRRTVPGSTTGSRTRSSSSATRSSGTTAGRSSGSTATRSSGTTASRSGTPRRAEQRHSERSRSRSHHPATNAPSHARRTPKPATARHRKGLPAGATFDARRMARRVKRAERNRHLWSVGSPRRRLLALFVVSALAFLGVIVRVGLLQIFEAEDYQAYGDRQRVRSEVLVAPRGAILDRDGNELAMSVAALTVYANPRAVVNPVETAETLAQLLGLSAEKQTSLEQAFDDPQNEFVYVSRQVEPELAARVAALDLPGVGLQEEPKRLLPNGPVARGIIGRTDIDGVGTGGIELQYQSVLTGRDGQLRREFGSKGRSMPSGDKALVDAVPGNDVVLTLDTSLQYRVEQYLVDAVDALAARGGSAIVMDTATGDILAMASARRVEGADRDDPEAVTTEVASGNFAAVDSYEPGSVVKVITVAAALNEGAVTPERVFTVPGEKKFYDLVLHDAEPHPPIKMTVQEILAKSSNIGTIFISQEIGTEKQEDYMRAFGLGEATALDFPGEGRGILKPHEQWYGTEKVTMAYGQGVASTAVQLVAAVNVLANRGVYVSPRLVSSVIGPDGTEQTAMPSASRQVVRPEVAEQMNLMMRDVVCTGTAKGRTDIKGYTVAGKTGTGYKAQPNGTYFDEDGNRAYYASFVGFFPAEAPRVTILVSIDEPPPGSAHFGSTTAAPVFAQIAKAAIVELGIQPATADGGCTTKQATG